MLENLIISGTKITDSLLNKILMYSTHLRKICASQCKELKGRDLDALLETKNLEVALCAIFPSPYTVSEHYVL